ncbi:response regulator [Blautia sp. RD014234]|nr:response regulator [Blautia parvula]
MSGTIHVESTLGAGSKFTVVLPMVLMEPDKQETGVLAGHTVLVVDDSPDTCEGIQLMLEEAGVHVDWALSGGEAVKAANRARRMGRDYFAVILDWKMPEMDGVETARRIRAISAVISRSFCCQPTIGRKWSRKLWKRESMDF